MSDTAPAPLDAGQPRGFRLERQSRRGDGRWKTIGRPLIRQGDDGREDLVRLMVRAGALAEVLPDLHAMRIVIDDARHEQIAVWSACRGWRVLVG